MDIKSFHKKFHRSGPSSLILYYIYIYDESDRLVSCLNCHYTQGAKVSFATVAVQQIQSTVGKSAVKLFRTLKVRMGIKWTH
jgi:hypothetical protein